MLVWLLAELQNPQAHLGRHCSRMEHVRELGELGVHQRDSGDTINTDTDTISELESWKVGSSRKGPLQADLKVSQVQYPRKEDGSTPAPCQSLQPLDRGRGDPSGYVVPFGGVLRLVRQEP